MGQMLERPDWVPGGWTWTHSYYAARDTAQGRLYVDVSQHDGMLADLYDDDGLVDVRSVPTSAALGIAEILAEWMGGWVDGSPSPKPSPLP